MATTALFARPPSPRRFATALSIVTVCGQSLAAIINIFEQRESAFLYKVLKLAIVGVANLEKFDWLQRPTRIVYFALGVYHGVYSIIREHARSPMRFGTDRRLNIPPIGSTE